VADITRADVREIYAELKDKRGRTTAGGAMRVLRALINTAMRIDETIKANPCEALRIPANPKRQVPMLDIAAWWLETEKLSPIRRDLNRAMLLTGARRRSILNVKRADVDLARRIILFRHMKVGGPMMLPIGRRLTAMLKARMEDDVPLNSEWLWPSVTSASGHVEEPKEVYRAEVPSAHEYRHHARTLFIAAGVPYAESALLLGQTLPGASGGYVHSEHLVEHLRPFMQALEDRVFAARLEIEHRPLLAIEDAHAA
jgi:integrase